MPTLSPNMGLVIPTIAVDSGLVWEQSVNASLAILDRHNHSSGQGVRINPAGILINSDFPFNNNNLTLARSIRFQPQASALALTADIGCLYEAGVDLYYNDGAGNQIRITSGGTVNATSSGIAFGTATASFVSSVLVVNSATNTPANIQAGSILLGNNTVNSKYLTLSPPNAMGSNYTLTLPSIPVTTSFMTMDSSGNMGTSVALPLTGTNIAGGTITGSNIASATVARTNLVAVGQQVSGSSGTYSTTNSSYTQITNQTVTITTSGRPVVICMQSDGTGNTTYYASGGQIRLQLLRGSTVLSNPVLVDASNNQTSIGCPIFHIDPVGAGTYTYSVNVAALTGSALFYYYSLFVYEL